VETLGPINGSAYGFFEILGRKITDVTGDSREVSLNFKDCQSSYRDLMRPCFVTRSLCTTIRTSSHSNCFYQLCFCCFNLWNLYYRGEKNNSQVACSNRSRQRRSVLRMSPRSYFLLSWAVRSWMFQMTADSPASFISAHLSSSSDSILFCFTIVSPATSSDHSSFA